MRSLIFLSLILASRAVIAAPADLEVKITNLNGTGGFVLVSVFNQPNGFPKDTSKAVVKLKLTVAQAKHFIIEDLAPGVYAAAIAHDENGNGKIDKNVMGIPKEGFGFSNDAMGTFGPPSFEKASFNVRAPVSKISITTKHF